MNNEIKNLAQELAFDFERSNDKDFVRRIELAIIGFRATIIRQDYNKTGRFADSLIESFCVPLIQVKETECCHTGEENCNIWRSEFKLPTPVRTKDGTNFVFVGNVNNTEAYTNILPEEYISIKKGTRYAKLKKFYASYNQYLYVFNSGNNQKLRVRYVPDNPEELLSLKSCEGKPCIDTIDLNEDMKKIIKDWVKQELRGGIPRETEIEINGNKQS
jgi:hypothetical protein